MIIAKHGVGCACNGACDSCRIGMGDVTEQSTTPAAPTIFDQLWAALSTTLPLGPNGIPIWVLALAGVIAAASIMTSPTGRRR